MSWYNIWKLMCIKKLSYITDTYLRYNIQREKQVEKYEWVLYHELVLFLKNRNCFWYVPDNDIKREILGCTPSSVDHARHATYIVVKYSYTATVKTSTKFYKTTLSYDMIFTKADASTSDDQVEKLTR